MHKVSNELSHCHPFLYYFAVVIIGEGDSVRHNLWTYLWRAIREKCVFSQSPETELVDTLTTLGPCGASASERTVKILTGVEGKKFL